VGRKYGISESEVNIYYVGGGNSTEHRVPSRAAIKYDLLPFATPATCYLAADFATATPRVGVGVATLFNSPGAHGHTIC